MRDDEIETLLEYFQDFVVAVIRKEQSCFVQLGDSAPTYHSMQVLEKARENLKVYLKEYIGEP